MTGPPRTIAAQRAKRLYDLLAAESFWCETCHGWHPLCEHRDCRTSANQAGVQRAREAITRKENP